jgi:prevent-host-death family protein
MSQMIKASEFKAKCLGLIDEISRTGGSVVVTKNGRPLVEVIPYKPKPKNARGILKGKVEIVGDIVSPNDVDWDAMK